MEALKHLDFSFASEEPVQGEIRQWIVSTYKVFCETRKPGVFVFGKTNHGILYDLIGEIAANNMKALDFIKIGCDRIMIDTPENLAKMDGMTGNEIRQSAFCVFKNYHSNPAIHGAMKSR